MFGAESKFIEEDEEKRIDIPIIQLPEEPDEIEHRTMTFHNWGQTVITQPYRIYYPKTKHDICTIVNWAKSHNKGVRVSAYKHSWTNFYVKDNDILVSLLEYEQSEILPSIHKDISCDTPFQKIQLVGTPFQENGKTKHLCTIGAATTNDQFRNWAVSNFKLNGTSYSWTVPCNVILVENTFGGTNSMICHGAGINNQTLSDLVTEIEFVNPRGQLQRIGYKITDPVEAQDEGRKLIKSAAGSFGQLGVVTELTLKLDQMTHAQMHPARPRLALAVPPPDGFTFPDFLPANIMNGVTAEQLLAAKEDFDNRCATHYYSEWFWCGFHPNCFTNTWINNGKEEDSQIFPSPFKTKLQEVALYIASLANSSILRFLPPKWQTLLLSDATMFALPPSEKFVVPLPDALHFQRGIHNMPVQDMEFEIPIPLLPNGKPDWSICQRAWWDAIVTVYEFLVKKDKVPMRLPLEMRIMGGSDITMAAQKGNQYGTCAIEVLTLGRNLVDKNEWHEFMQAILDKWSTYTDVEGKPLNIRPHWAKQWKGLTIQRNGELRKNIMDYVKEIYKDEISVFNKDLERIAEKGGYTANEFRLFSNPLVEQIFHDKEAPQEEESLNLSAVSAPSKDDLLDHAQSIHSLILKSQQAHKAQAKYLAKKYKLSSEKIDEEVNIAVTNKNESFLAIHSWFSTGLSKAQNRELTIEAVGEKNSEATSSCCLRPRCSIM